MTRIIRTDRGRKGTITSPAGTLHGKVTTVTSNWFDFIPDGLEVNSSYRLQDWDFTVDTLPAPVFQTGDTILHAAFFPLVYMGAGRWLQVTHGLSREGNTIYETNIKTDKDAIARLESDWSTLHRNKALITLDDILLVNADLEDPKPSQREQYDALADGQLFEWGAGGSRYRKLSSTKFWSNNTEEVFDTEPTGSAGYLSSTVTTPTFVPVSG